MFFHGFYGVLRTGWSITATSGQQWRYAVPVKIDRQQDDKLKYLFHDVITYKLLSSDIVFVESAATGLATFILSINFCNAIFIFFSTVAKSSSSSET